MIDNRRFAILPDQKQARIAGKRIKAAGAGRAMQAGAGDIFAAAFFLWMERHRDPWGAARFANCVASHSVTRVGVSGTPTPEEAARCRRAMHGDR